MDENTLWEYAKTIGLASLVGLLLFKIFKRKRYQTVTKVNEKYDYIIVGGGSAGAVLAARLSEDSDVTVLLVEAGGEETSNTMFKIPIAAPLLQQSESDWEYYSVPQKFSSKASLKGENRHYMPRGKVLGGSSIFNYMQYVRGSRYDYDEWAENGCIGWSYKDVLPYFIKSEDVQIEDLKGSRYHGTGGPLAVSLESGNLSKVFVQAGKELGYAGDVDYNGEQQEGFSVSQVTVRKGERASTAKEFLRPAMSRPNLHVVVNAHVAKVLVNNNSATGITFHKDGKETTVNATREVILCAGAFGSPQILLLSGIGPKEHLKEHNIPVVQDLQVGENLQDHVLGFICSDISTKDSLMKSKVESLPSLVNYMLFGKGPLASTPLSGTAFISSEANKHKYPDIQFHMLPGCGQLNDVKFDHEMVQDMFHEEQQEGATLVPILLHPKSRGTVRLASSNIFDHPLIDPNFLGEKEDLDTLIRAMKIGYKMMETEALKSIGANTKRFQNIKICKGLKFQSDEYYECFLRHVAQTCYHPTSTCKMGRTDDPTTVVDPELRVKGVEKLRVVDASAMPNVVSGNTNAAVIMMAEKAADMIRGKDTVADIRKKLASE